MITKFIIRSTANSELLLPLGEIGSFLGLKEGSAVVIAPNGERGFSVQPTDNAETTSRSSTNTTFGPLPPLTRARQRIHPSENTHLREYRRPLLEALDELGGVARPAQVLDRIFKKMKSQFKPADLQPIQSTDEERWRNHARWQRKECVTEGLLKSTSPHNQWEISEKGRQWLKMEK